MIQPIITHKIVNTMQKESKSLNLLFQELLIIPIHTAYVLKESNNPHTASRIYIP